MVNKKVIFKKILKMFRPCDRKFLKYSKKDVIMGPNDRAEFGFDTYFPIEWLIEDYNFTLEEAKWFVRKVCKLHE